VAYADVTKWAIDLKDAHTANEVGLPGAKNGSSEVVMAAGESAIKLEPTNGNYRDTRGVARAYAGDLAGTAADFEAYLEWASGRQISPATLQRRNKWIAKLKAGVKPTNLPITN